MSSRRDLNQGPHAPKANTITTELKRILPNAGIVLNQDAVTHEGVVSRNTLSSFNQYSAQYSFQATGCFPT